jgi:hypothetical protein
MPSSFETFTDGEFDALRTNGIKVDYWVVCQIKALALRQRAEDGAALRPGGAGKNLAQTGLS